MAKEKGRTKKTKTVVIPAKDIYLYQLTEEELRLLGNGGGELQLTFATFCISITIALGIALATCMMPDITKIVFIILSVVLAIIGLYFSLSWYFAHRKNKHFLENVLSRKQIE